MFSYDAQEGDATIDWLPPWLWEPWNQDWKPLPAGAKWIWEIEEAQVTVAGATSDQHLLPAADILEDGWHADDNVSAVDILTETSYVAFSGPDLMIMADLQPSVVEIVFQVSDTPWKPYDGNRDSLVEVLSKIANVNGSAVKLTQVYRDLTQELVTVTARVFTDNPIDIALSFTVADRNGQLAASLANVGLEYLEVSMTATVTYAGDGVYDQTVESMEAEGNNESKQPTPVTIVASSAAAVVVACLIGLLTLKLAHNRQRFAQQPGAATAVRSPAKSATDVINGTIQMSS